VVRAVEEGSKWCVAGGNGKGHTTDKRVSEKHHTSAVFFAKGVRKARKRLEKGEVCTKAHTKGRVKQGTKHDLKRSFWWRWRKGKSQGGGTGG